eukprot:257875_1
MAAINPMHQKRLSKLISHLHPNPTTSSAEAEYVVAYRAKLRQLREELREFIDKINCNPIIVRLAWHDAGTYDDTIGTGNFPRCGGANGSIRFKKELAHGANAGLEKAVNYLRPFKEKYPEISWADLIQLASVTAIEHAGGPLIPIRFGRLDAMTDKQCPPEGNLPDGAPPFAGGRDPDAATHLRRVFYRMGFNDQEIVALSGAHTLGRAFKERSGTVKEGYGDRTATRYTRSDSKCVRSDNKAGVGMSGGKSWSKDWLTFNTGYWSDLQSADPEILRLRTDQILFVDEGFKKYAKLYEDRGKFFADYIKAHTKLSENGSVFKPKQGFYI